MTQTVPFRPVRLDLAIEDARPSSVRVPEGYYLLECDGCDAPTQTATSTGAWFRFHIVAAPDNHPNVGLNGHLSDRVTIESVNRDRNHFPLTAALVALGRADVVSAFAQMSQDQQTAMTMERLAQVFERISAAVKGRKAVGDVRDRQGQSQPISSIEGLLPEAEWDTLKKAAVYTAPVGPVGIPVGTPGAPGANGPAAGGDLFSDLDRTI